MKDCSGGISAVAFGLFIIAGSLLLFFLLSGPPTFMESVTLAPGDTWFHTPTWSRLWCECLLFESANNVSKSDIAVFSLASNAAGYSSSRVRYNVTQEVGNPALGFEYWESNFHPRSSARVHFSFNRPVSFYFSPRYYVDGESRDPDFVDNWVVRLLNVTSGVVETPAFTEDGSWAFVWEKDFQAQATTTGTVVYEFSMTELNVPATNSSSVKFGSGEFCWDLGASMPFWLLVASRDAPTNAQARLQANLWCVPRYALSVPITAIPVAIALVLEILIIYFCICRVRRVEKSQIRYQQIQ